MAKESGQRAAFSKETSSGIGTHIALEARKSVLYEPLPTAHTRLPTEKFSQELPAFVTIPLNSRKDLSSACVSLVVESASERVDIVVGESALT